MDLPARSLSASPAHSFEEDHEERANFLSTSSPPHHAASRSPSILSHTEDPEMPLLSQSARPSMDPIRPPLASHFTEEIMSPVARTGTWISKQLTTLSQRTPTLARVPVVAVGQPLYSNLGEDNHLSFYQRNFTKPSDNDPEKALLPGNRRFSFLSRGFLLTLAFMFVLLIGVVAAAVAISVEHRHSTPSKGPVPPAPAPPNTGTTSPIRAAINENFPDPSIWYNNGTWYAYGTNNAAGILGQSRGPGSGKPEDSDGAKNVQLATSTDFANWTLQTSSASNALPGVGRWAVQGDTNGTGPHVPRANVWAPMVMQRPDGKYVLYYSAGQNKTGNYEDHISPHCIGAALTEADSPLGPYTAINDALACPMDQGGAIDPYGFQDPDGTYYVVYKVDGNNFGHGGTCGNTVEPIVPTPLMLQKMQADALTPDGDPVQILDRTQADGPLVEAPALIRSKDGVYFLFFSSGCTRDASYDVKYATATNIAGPYLRADKPLLATGDWGLTAPGSVGLHERDDGSWNMVFHARVSSPEGGIRAVFSTKIELDGNDVKMSAP